jgi:hypothetical protein
MLTHGAIPGDRNVIKKETEKILKHLKPHNTNSAMWNLKAKVIPVRIGGPGITSKSFRQYRSNIPGNHEIKELQKQPYWAAHTYFGKR